MKNIFILWIVQNVFLFALFCQSTAKEQPMIEKTLFGILNDGVAIHSYTLKNTAGMQVKIIDYGATVVSLSVPDRTGSSADIVLGYDSLVNYVKDNAYLGTIVGRYGNRIGKGLFTLDKKEYRLSINNGENHLHGGIKGFNKMVWHAEPIDTTTDPALKLTLVSKDGDEGYPGTVNLSVVYTLTKNNELRIEYIGTTDKPTILNPTHHSYFNLTGDMTKTVLDHELMIDADKITPVDAGLIPTGEFMAVANTPFDFRKMLKIGTHIDDKNQQLEFGRGYDHNWVLNHYDAQVHKVAEVYEPSSGRIIEVFTDQPGIQFYSGNWLDGTIIGKHGVRYNKRSGLCLETQCFPDSPNKPQWHSVKLIPGAVYKQTTIYKFSAK
jgi:aldose 1-epimerase